MQNERENKDYPNAERDDFDARQIVDESVNKPADETVREVLRGDESKGDADERDIVGGSDSIDTPQGREEAKKDEGSDS